MDALVSKRELEIVMGGRNQREKRRAPKCREDNRNSIVASSKAPGSTLFLLQLELLLSSYAAIECILEKYFISDISFTCGENGY